MVMGVNVRRSLAAAAAAAAAIAAAKRRKKRRRRTLLTLCGGWNGAVDDAVGGTSGESCCPPGFGGTRDWSGLPDPAVHLILTALLPSIKDAFSLGSVCRAWRSVFAACKRDLFSALPPLLVDNGSSPLSHGGFYGLRERRFHRRKHNSDVVFSWTYSCGSPLRPRMGVIGVSHGYWIVHAVPLGWNRPTPVFLVDPLSPEVRIRLPLAPHNVYFGLMAAPPASPDCVVVLMDPERIYCCRPGDTQWVRHSFVEGGGGGGGGNHEASFVPSIEPQPHLVAIVGGKLYALDASGKVAIVELCIPRPTVTFLETKIPPPKYPLGFMMESNGEVLLVEDVSDPKLQELGLPPATSRGQHPCSDGHKFIVRRLDAAAQEWVTLSTLGDRCLFLKWGATCVTSVAPARWGGEGDRIYTFCPHLDRELLVFHLKDGRNEHHRMPKDYLFYDWLIPSFCY